MVTGWSPIGDDDFGAEVRFEIYRAGTLVPTAHWVDPPTIAAPHRMSIARGPEIWTTYSLRTGTDVSGCFG